MPFLGEKMKEEQRTRLEAFLEEGVLGEPTELPWLPGPSVGHTPGWAHWDGCPRGTPPDAHTESGVEFFQGEASLPFHVHPVKDHLQLLVAAQEAELGRLEGRSEWAAVPAALGPRGCPQSCLPPLFPQ